MLADSMVVILEDWVLRKKNRRGQTGLHLKTTSHKRGWV